MDNYFSSPASKVIKENNCVRRIRFSSTLETTIENDDSIIVYARIRPISSQTDSFLSYKDKSVYYKEQDKRGGIRTMSYSFHKVFDPHVTQEEIFNKTVDSGVDQFIKGNNRLLFAYGTTGSGKTFTMQGTSKQPGILPRCTVKIFKTLIDNMEDLLFCPDQGCDLRELSEEELNLCNDYREAICSLIEDCETEEDPDGFNYDNKDIERVLEKLYYELKSTDLGIDDNKYSVWVSYLEVYNEIIYDLLDIQKERKNLKLGLDSDKNNYVKGLLHINVKHWIDLWKIFLYGRSRLHTNETQLNKHSSRSHSIFTLKIIRFNNGRPTVNSLSICDLAGTERQKKAQNVGNSLKESKSINSSLLVLNRCFAVVRENKIRKQKNIAPFRESKLTQIFQKAFSYCEQITMFVNLSQSQLLSEETKNVLKMSALAQEMVKPMQPKKFIKPNSRFSIMCTNPSAPISSRMGIPIFSGIDFLSSTAISSTALSDETIKNYENKIKSLEEELKKANDEIASLVETLEDGRVEFLNLEAKNKELEANLLEEEIANDDMANNIEDLQIMLEIRLNSANAIEKVVEEEKHKNQILQEELTQINHLKNQEIEHLKEQNLALKQQLKEIEEKLDKKEKNKKGRQLLSALDHLVVNDSPEQAKENIDFDNFTPSKNFLASTSTRTPRSTRKPRSNRVQNNK